MKPSQETENSNHKYFYQAIESNKVNIDWLIQQLSALNKKIDRITFLSLTTLISLLVTLATFVLSHISFH